MRQELKIPFNTAIQGGEVQLQLSRGGNFETLAKENSSDSSAQEGGDLCQPVPVARHVDPPPVSLPLDVEGPARRVVVDSLEQGQQHQPSNMSNQPQLL